MKKYLTILLTAICLNSFSQTEQEIYEQAFQKLICMLDETCSASLKEAVFIVENAYFSNMLDRVQYDKRITFASELARQLIASRELVYNLPDREEVGKHAAIYSVLKDSIPILVDSNTIVHIPPYTYDFNDIWGNKEWSNMFVSKLLDTKKGNCHSLPILYKIIADEIGAKTYISLAPNHMYIKLQNKANGWYNTELTSGVFPIDAWLMASGYIHLDAIVNKLYMEALNDKQTIALCMTDLAKGYERKHGDTADLDFVLKCCDATLKYYPNYINALLLKAETKKRKFDLLMAKHNTKNPQDILTLPEAKQIFSEMTAEYSRIHDLGYRAMPENMYMDWLLLLKEERNKYENKEIINFKPITK